MPKVLSQIASGLTLALRVGFGGLRGENFFAINTGSPRDLLEDTRVHGQPAYRSPASGASDQFYGEAGSFYPFAPTRPVRATDDSRLSMEERYTGREQYLGKIAVVGRRLIADRLLLATDFAELIDQALVQYDWAVQAQRK